MAGSAEVMELEELIARFPERMSDSRFTAKIARQGRRIKVRYAAVDIDARGMHYRFTFEARTGYELTEGVCLMASPRRARIVISVGDGLYTAIEPFDLIALATNASKKLSDLDTALRIKQTVASLRTLLE